MAVDPQATTPTQVEDGPWNWDWKKLATAAGNTNAAIIDEGNAGAASADSLVPQNPWEMSADQLAKLTNNKRELPADYVPNDMSQAAPTKTNFNSTGDVFAKLINTESGGNHLDSSGNLITSNKGAKGITQLMPATSGDPGFGVTPLQNQSEGEYLRFGRDYLNAMIKHFGGNTEQAVAAYNAGPGAIQRAVAKGLKTGQDWKSFIPAETKQYVRSILG